MTNQQILALVLATAPTMFVVLVGILINNSRLSDVNARLNDLDGRIAELRSHMDALQRY
jgi:hypothetical protein